AVFLLRRGAVQLFNRAATGEAVLDAMPVADRVLAELPAQEDGLAAMQGGEVDEPLVEVLHLGAVLRDRVDRARERSRLALHGGGRGGEKGGRNPPAVPAEGAPQPLRLLGRGDVRAGVLDQLPD